MEHMNPETRGRIAREISYAANVLDNAIALAEREQAKDLEKDLVLTQIGFVRELIYVSEKHDLAVVTVPKP